MGYIFIWFSSSIRSLNIYQHVSSRYTNEKEDNYHYHGNLILVFAVPPAVKCRDFRYTIVSLLKHGDCQVYKWNRILWIYWKYKNVCSCYNCVCACSVVNINFRSDERGGGEGRKEIKEITRMFLILQIGFSIRFCRQSRE